MQRIAIQLGWVVHAEGPGDEVVGLSLIGVFGSSNPENSLFSFFLSFFPFFRVRLSLGLALGLGLGVGPFVSSFSVLRGCPSWTQPSGNEIEDNKRIVLMKITADIVKRAVTERHEVLQ